MISGARIGHTTWLRRLVARGESHVLTAFIVPGSAIARARGLDLAAAGLTVVSSPRHAAVLVGVGELPEGLVQPAAVAYAQMARPRAILTIGTTRVASLPTPDVTVPLDQAALTAGIADLRRRFAAGAWAVDAEAFAIEVAESNGATSHRGHDHHMMQHGAHGEMLMTEGEHLRHDSAMEHDRSHGDMPIPMDHGEETGHDTHGDIDMPMTPGNHGGHGGMTMNMDIDMSGGFMSMVAMTQSLPRSRDGLPMEWVEAPFGPLFPGLPGGLALMLTLDGDTVAQARVTPGAVHRGLAATWPGPAAGFPDRLALLDPQMPVAYRELASRALEDAAAFTVAEAVTRQRVSALERERAVSHLSWLAEFATLLGDRWLAERAADLQFALMHVTDDPDLSRVGQEIVAFVRRAQRLPLLKRRLDGIGHETSLGAETIGGPFARACGMAVDARRDDPAYRALGFAPVRHDGNDAWARLQVRLAELMQSMDLIRAVGATILPAPPAPTVGAGAGTATVETPRGPATLDIVLHDGQVDTVQIDTPSARLVTLVPGMAEGREVADALVGIASLDLSPWEMDR
jgi:Ni,Fe-hydrogenase III large subunit